MSFVSVLLPLVVIFLHPNGMNFLIEQPIITPQDMHFMNQIYMEASTFIKENPTKTKKEVMAHLEEFTGENEQMKTALKHILEKADKFKKSAMKLGDENLIKGSPAREIFDQELAVIDNVDLTPMEQCRAMRKITRPDPAKDITQTLIWMVPNPESLDMPYGTWECYRDSMLLDALDIQQNNGKVENGDGEKAQKEGAEQPEELKQQEKLEEPKQSEKLEEPEQADKLEEPKQADKLEEPKQA